MDHYDLIVVGAGSGNMVVTDDWSGRRVALIEQDRFGGTCLNRGCIPSKMLVLAADAAEHAAHSGHLDVRTRFEGVDWPALRDRVFGRTDADSDEGRRTRQDQDFVTVLVGPARFTGPRTLTVRTDDGPVTLTGDQIVLATGSRPVLPDVPGLGEARPHTSDTIMRIATLPRRLGIIGGGDIGCELAHVFSALGVQVVQVETEPRLLAGKDRDVAELFTRLARQRWDVRVGATLQRVHRDSDAIRLELEDGTVEVDELLVVTGRRPNSDRLDLDGTGVEVDDAGRIVVDEYQRTTAAGIWSLGDASSHEALKHAANQDARVVAHNVRHPDDLVRSDHRAVPQAVFSSPQVAAVGLTESAARDRGVDLAVVSVPYADTAYGWALNADDAGYFVKVLGDRATGRLVGAHIIGPQAPALIQPLIDLVMSEQPVAGVARRQYWIHPAPTEVVENALLRLQDQLARR